MRQPFASHVVFTKVGSMSESQSKSEGIIANLQEKKELQKPDRGAGNTATE